MNNANSDMQPLHDAFPMIDADMRRPKLGLSSAAAARALGVSPDTLADYRDRGLIAHHKVPGRAGRFSYWYPREAIEDFRKATYVAPWGTGNNL